MDIRQDTPLGRRLRCLAFLVPFCLAGPTHAGYTFHFLEQLPQHGLSTPYAINNAGQILGHQSDWDLPNNSTVIWQGTRIATNITATLGALPGTVKNFSPQAINNAGVVSGSYVTRDTGDCPPSVLCSRAATWDGSGVTVLPGNHVGGVALDINDAGHAVGHIPGPGLGVNPFRATLWRDGAVTHLETLGETYSLARAINNSDVIVGRSGARPIMWHNGDVFDLGTLGGSTGEANDVNDKNQIVGSSRAGDGVSRATLWDNGAIVDLGSLARNSAAFAINENGLIVGISNGRAAMWENGVITDLNDFLPAYLKAREWSLGSALDVNDNGWIIGGIHNPSGEALSFLLVPSVPEPGISLMLGVGIGLTLLAARRRDSALRPFSTA